MLFKTPYLAVLRNLIINDAVCRRLYGSSIRSNMLSSKILKDGNFEQNANSDLLSPPSAVRGMKILDREKFSKTIVVPWLSVHDHFHDVMKLLKKYTLKLQGFKSIQDLEQISGAESAEPKHKINKKIILNPVIVNTFNDIKEEDRLGLNNYQISKESLNFSHLKLTYDNWRADETLKSVLPEDKDSLTSYSLIGHIVHVNLRDHLLEYKNLIGQVLLDKVNGARTVVNKVDCIDNTYRNFSMEILCGTNDMMAQVKENHCTFEFDFSSVYWNPRLSTEHERIVQKLMEGDILYDIFAGVGPFAIPVAKKKCFVLANDLNPESYKWLQHNAKLNKVQQYVHTFNKDGGLFIKEDLRNHMLKQWKDECFEKNMHITMNLPAMAVTFLKNFRGLFNWEELQTVKFNNLPIVHLYCFTKGEDPETLAKDMVEQNLHWKLNDHSLQIFRVRNVSVKKEMMRVTFMLSREILTTPYTYTRGREVSEIAEEPVVKRLCIGQDGIETKEGKEEVKGRIMILSSEEF